MARTSPLVGNATRTHPAPDAGAAPAPAGAALKEWTVVDLSLANFHITQKPGLANPNTWVFSNPAAGQLRVQNNGNGIGGVPPDSSVENWWGAGTQDGPILILKVGAMNPRPDYADPAGVSANQWRCEDAQLTVQMRYTVDAVGNVNAGNDGTGIGISPGFIFFGADQGADAALVTANPAPPYNSGSYGRSSYYTLRCNKSNPGGGAGHNWDFGVSYSGYASATGSFTGPLGSAGVMNTVQCSVVQSYSNRQSIHEDFGACMGSVFDSRLVDGPGLVRSNESKPGWHGDLEVDGKYVYIALFVLNWTTQDWTAGTHITIEDLRYVVQPMRNRSLT